MSEKIKGYVVKGIDLSNGDGADVWAMAGGERLAMVDERRFATEWTDIAGAEDAVTTIRRWRDVGLGDVRIFAVAEDGTEAPLRTYEEALAEIDAARRTIPEEHRGYTSLHLSIAAMLGEYDGARAEIERLRGVVVLARRLVQGSDLGSTGGGHAAITCDEEPYAALAAIFEAEREAERLIPGLVCAECDRPIYRGSAYGGKGGHAAHRACRNWPAGAVFKVAGSP